MIDRTLVGSARRSARACVSAAAQPASSNQVSALPVIVEDDAD
jgi:hypothetical protein